MKFYYQFYYPYKSDKPEKKYFIITNTSTGKRVYFGQAGAEDFTIHKTESRREAYRKRHEKNENWTKSGIDTPGFWSWHYLWEFPTKKEAYENIKKKYL